MLLVFAALAPAAEPSSVELTLSSTTIAPTTTFELRFNDAMATQDTVGKPAPKSPVVFKPALEGTFNWLDFHRGVFEPSAPMPLNTTYELSLRKGLLQANGQPLKAEWHATVSTPPMTLQRVAAVEYINHEDIPAQPSLLLTFNTAVAPRSAASSLTFVDDAGEKITANVETPGRAIYGETLYTAPGGDSSSARGWRAQYLEAAGKDAGNPFANQLLVKPSKPFIPGKGWKLVAAAGLPSSEEPTRLPAPIASPLGEFHPFVVKEAAAQNYVLSGTRVVIQLSKAVDRSVTAENLAWWVVVSPAPADLKAIVEGSTIEFTGHFELGPRYHVTVSKELPGSEPVALESSFGTDVVFKEVAPRLYFEEFATHQMSTGSRQFHLRTVNVPAVHITAKVISPEGVPQALEAWSKYEKEWGKEGDAADNNGNNPNIGDGNNKADYDEPYQRIDESKLSGNVAFEKDFPVAGAVDEKQELALNWNEILGTGRTGVVLLTAEAAPQPGAAPGDKRPAAQAIVQVTDLGAIWKGSRHETFLYVFSLATGQPVPSARLQLFDDKQKPVGEATTDASGSARLPEDRKAKWVLVSKANDWHLLPFAERSEINLMRCHSVQGEEIESDDATGLDDAEEKLFLFTERDVYRPGETLHLKGVAREFSSGASRPPTGQELRLVAKDSRSRTILDRHVTLSEMGSFDADIPLASSSVGSYFLTVNRLEPPKGDEEPRDLASKIVQVEEFEPNPFEIILSGAPSVIAPAPLPVSVDARYYMGKPLSKAQLKWTIRAQDDGFSPAGFDAFGFCNDIHDYRVEQALDRVSEYTTQGEVDLSNAGRATVTAAVPSNPKAPQPRKVHVLCEVTDLDQKTVSAEHDFTVDSSDYYLGVHHFPEVLREGAPLPVQAVAVGRDGQLWKEAVQMKVKITRIDWQTNRVEGAGDAAIYNSEPVFHVVEETTVSSLLPKKVGKKWELPDGAGLPTQLKTGKPGQYLIELQARDAAGREALTSETYYVYGAAEMVWNYRNPFQIDLTTDKESYRPGEKAVILVKTPISGEALVSVERENVRRAFVTRLEGNAPSVEIPVEDADAPNVYVSVMLLRGGNDSPRKIKAPEYRVGYARLTVERPAAKLAVYVLPDATAHRPGDPVSVSAEVLDYLGKPVPNAELTLYAVDEGVLALTGYQTPNLFDFFNQPRALGVHTGLTLPQMLSENPDDRDYSNKGFLVGDKGGEDRIRRNFLPCAFWGASLKTGPDGRAHADFTAPDGLTRYRIIGVAQTVRDQFGSAESAFEINKPVMLEPAAPQFANVGDKILLRAVVHNSTDVAGEVEVRLDLDETVSAKSTSQHLTLPAQGSIAVDFPVEFKKMGSAKWIWAADFVSTDGAVKHHDAAAVSMKVDYPAPPRREITFARISEPEVNVLERIHPDLLDGFGTLRVDVANTRVSELGEAVRDLLQYPYGCVEQTVSNFLPWLVLRDLRTALPELNKSDEEVRAAVDRGIDRLLTMETESGGLAYWPGGKRAELWASAYGGLGMALARRAGMVVPGDDFDNLCKYLSAQLRGLAQVTTTADYSQRCLAVYALALAGKPEAAYHELLYNHREKLSAENRALLALAIIESKGPPAMVEALLDPKAPVITDPDDYRWFGSLARTAALRLLAWVRFRPQDPEVDRLAGELFSLRQGGDWITTQGNAWAVLAMADYVRAVEQPGRKSSGTVAWGEQKQTFSLDDKTHSVAAGWPLSATGGLSQPVRIANPDSSPLFAQVSVESRPWTIEQPRQDSAYGIRRTYYRVGDDGQLRPFGQPVVGDRVLVVLQISVRQAARYLAIEDPLPSILEAISPELQPHHAVGGNLVSPNWATDYQEMRNDRALFFYDEALPGRYTLCYLARVRAAGTAVAPPAKIEEMYHPERFGQTETLRLTSAPLK